MREAAISIRAVADFERRAVRWLWPGRIPLGKLTILSGDPSLGKSLLTLDLAARVSAAREWPDAPTQTDNSLSRLSGHPTHQRGTPDNTNPTRQRGSSSRGSPTRQRGAPTTSCPTRDLCPLTSSLGRVLLLAAEDDVGDTIRPRLEAAGADLSRIHVLEGLRDADGNRGFVALHRDCDLIADLLRERNDWRLIVIDPISAYFDGMDPNSNADVRTVLGRLADLAEQTGAAVVLVSHHRKGGYSGPAIHKTIGSLAFAAVARVVWNVLRDPADPDRRLLVPVKMNLGPPPTALAFQITTQTDSPSSPRSPTRQQGSSAGSPTRQRGTPDRTDPTRQQGSSSPLQTQTDNLLSRPTRARHKRSTQTADPSSPSPLTSDLSPLTAAPTPVLRWDPHPIEFSPDDPTENAFAETDEHDRLDHARDWLRAQLLPGRRPSADLKRCARQAGISLRALWRAKRALGVTAVKDAMTGPWYWAPPPALDLVDLTQLLPPLPPPPPPPQPPPKTVEEFLRRYPPSPETLALVRAERERRRKAREAANQP